MKIGFLFPGQGSQSVGMGKDLYQKYPEAKKIYDEVSKIVKKDIAKISFEGPVALLNETENTQLAIITESLAILEILKKNNIKSDINAGLSLGEYTALIENGIFDLKTGVEIVQKRGRIMQELTPKGNWRMAAVIGLRDDEVRDICSKVNCGFISPANYNTIGQVVISGEIEAVEQATNLAKERDAKKVALLNTAGPFHTEKLKECSIKLKQELTKIKINKKNSKVIKNIDGKLYQKDDDITEVLSEHIISPVLFSKSLTTMYEDGIDTFVEIGPGKTLSGFVKRMNFENKVKILNINNVSTLENVLKEVEENE